MPVTIPFKDDDRIAEESVQNDTGIINEAVTKCEINDFFLFQFPRIIPIRSSIEKAVVENEQMKEEPTYDNHGFLVKPDFENHFKDFPKNSKIGKLKVYKSGKVKIQLGEVMFNLDVGVNTNFAQFYGGTSLLILVGVVLDTLQQIESHLLMRHYDGLMKSGRIKGRTAVGAAV